MNGNEAEIEVADDIQLEKRTSYLDIIKGKIQKENKVKQSNPRLQWPTAS